MLCEIPIPDGWEFIGYRSAEPSEYVMVGTRPYQVVSGTSSPMIIIRKQWQPPDFLPDGWIAMDGDLRYWWHKEKPVKRQTHWSSGGGCACLSELIWDRPPVTDWQESLREIKRAKNDDIAN